MQHECMRQFLIDLVGLTLIWAFGNYDLPEQNLADNQNKVKPTKSLTYSFTPACCCKLIKFVIDKPFAVGLRPPAAAW